MRKLKLRIGYDTDAECPNDWDGWTLYSFSTRHNSFRDPYKFLLDDYDNINIGIQSKLRAGTAFWLDYYEHGNCSWTLSGEGMSCPWDSVRHGGILLWERSPEDLGPKDYKGREKDARNFAETYTNWANGWCFWFDLETDDGRDVDSGGGFYSDDDVEEAIKELLDDGDIIIEVSGDAKDMADYMHKLPIDLDHEEPEEDEEVEDYA